MASEDRPAAPAWTIRRNRFQERLRGEQPPVTMWVTTPWTGVIETLGAAGADAAILDLEHVSYGLETAEGLIIACEAAGISPIVRPPGLSSDLVSRVLDAGAQGIVFPQIEDAEQAATAVGCVRYRPSGTRGWGGAHTRWAGWQGGYAGDLLSAGTVAGVYDPEYVKRSHADVVAIMLVETVAGVDQIEQIAAVPGIDAVIFGWGDFSIEVGFDTDRCREAAAAVTEACRRNSVGVALSPGQSAYPGCFTIAGVDSLHMSGAVAAAVARARAQTSA